ncbi:unnamed protein product [Pedinophyceae sp. YPF-701]|nr:unnamed protein product [Pedinophyceae sp. YPF-701]
MFELTPAAIKQLCKEKQYYMHKPELNEVLHLQYKGIVKLENLEAFTGVRALYLEANAIEEVENLDHMTQLRSLYIANNLLREVYCLANLKALETLDVSGNLVDSLDGLAQLPKLGTLVAVGNRLEKPDAIEELRRCEALHTLDISNNKLDDEATWEILISLPLKYLRMQGNPVVRRVSAFRKRTLAAMPTLTYLDDAPAFEKDRRLAEAFVAGGYDAERAERDKIRQEEELKRQRSRQAFNDFVEDAKRRHKENPPPPHDPMRFRAVPVGESDSEDDSDLPPSCRISRKGRGLDKQGRPVNAPLAHVAGDADALQGADGDADDWVVLDKDEASGAEGDAAPEAAAAAAAEGGECAEEAGGVEEVGEVASGGVRSPPVPPPVPVPEMAGLSVTGLAPVAPIDPEELRRRREECLCQQTQFRKDLQERALARAASKADVMQQKLAEAAAGSGGGHGGPSPVVWGTQRYKELWKMAQEVPEGGESEEGAGREGREAGAAVEGPEGDAGAAVEGPEGDAGTAVTAEVSAASVAVPASLPDLEPLTGGAEEDLDGLD